MIKVATSLRESFILLSAAAPIAMIVMFLVLGVLSQHLDEVVKMGHLYRWFFVAASITSISLVVRLLSIGFSDEAFMVDSRDTAFSIAYTLPLATGIIISLVVAWRYWGWLIYANDTIAVTRDSKSSD